MCMECMPAVLVLRLLLAPWPDVCSPARWHNSGFVGGPRSRRWPQRQEIRPTELVVSAVPAVRVTECSIPRLATAYRLPTHPLVR